MNLRCDVELDDTEGLISYGLSDAEARKEVIKRDPAAGRDQGSSRS